MDHAALLIEPHKFSEPVLQSCVNKIKDGGTLDLVVLNVDSALVAVQHVALHLYEAAFRVSPLRVHINVVFRLIPNVWQQLFLNENPEAGLGELGQTQSVVMLPPLKEETRDLLKEGSPEDVGKAVRGQFKTVAVGGTFDHLHYGHKLLLTLAGWITSGTLIVGITDADLLKNKKYSKYLESYNDREKSVRSFVHYVFPDIKVRPEPIRDIYGPTGTEVDIDALVVSHETRGGAVKVNELRNEKNWKQLKVVEVGLIGGEAAKLSSTDLRKLEAQRNDAQL